VRIALLAVATAALVLAVSSPAAANGRFPASNQLVFSPSDPNLVVLRTTFGILISHDDGTTWTWLCEDVLGLPPTSNEDPSLGLTANNTMIAGISHGLDVSPDVGCNWAFAGGGLGNQLVKDVVVRPDAPHTALAITSTFSADGGADGGAGYGQQVFASTDDGTTFAPSGAPIDPAAIVTTVEVAKSDPQRLYVSAFRGIGATRTASLFVSTDAGGHWTERPSPLDPANESAVYIAAVDPTNADRVYLRSEGLSRLFVTGDAGKTYQIPVTLKGQMLGFALSPDGSKVYVGSKEDGLLMATSASLAFTQTSTVRVQCLAARGSELWACSDEPSGFIAGVSQNDGQSFTAKLHLNGIDGTVACAADAAAAVCNGAPYQSLCYNLGGCATDDGGIDGGGAGDDGGPPVPPPPPRSNSGCSAVGGGSAAVLLSAGAIAAIALRRRRGAPGARGRR
jgi:hypothetical protein